jgi:hypothetical protein
MNQLEDPFGKFVDDGMRIEAVRLRERRRLWLGLAFCASTVFALVLGDSPVAVLGALGVIVQGLMR